MRAQGYGNSQLAHHWLFGKAQIMNLSLIAFVNKTMQLNINFEYICLSLTTLVNKSI
jgi:hypothetical protein